MNKYSLREIAELVGIFSIVAGLMLVAYELRQNSQLMRAQVFNERSSQGIEVFLAVADNRELSAIDAKLTEAGFPDDPTAYFELSDIEKRQYVWLLRADRFRLENILYQQVIGVMEYDDGHLGGAYNVLRRYEAIGPDSAPFSGHGPARRLERLIDEVEEMHGPSNQR
jgi:hypothetical protein